MSTDKLEAHSPAQTSQAKTNWLVLPSRLYYGVQIRHHLQCLSAINGFFSSLRSVGCSFNTF